MAILPLAHAPCPRPRTSPHVSSACLQLSTASVTGASAAETVIHAALCRAIRGLWRMTRCSCFLFSPDAKQDAAAGFILQIQIENLYLHISIGVFASKRKQSRLTSKSSFLAAESPLAGKCTEANELINRCKLASQRVLHGALPLPCSRWTRGHSD